MFRPTDLLRMLSVGLLPRTRQKLLAGWQHLQPTGGELRQTGGKLLRTASRKSRLQEDIRTVIRTAHHAATGGNLQLHPL